MANRSYGYKNIKSESGEFSCHIKKAINDKLDIYCRVNGINKTMYVNQLVENDMEEKFKRLKEANNE
jgi:hypothetical protein